MKNKFEFTEEEKQYLSNYYEFDDRADELEFLVKNVVNNEYFSCFRTEIFAIDIEKRIFVMEIWLKMETPPTKKYLKEKFGDSKMLFKSALDFRWIALPFDVKNEDITEEYISNIIKANESIKGVHIVGRG